MDVKTRLGLLLAGTVLGTSILISAPAFADDAQLQQQINAMQQQLQTMQNQLAETKKQAKAAASKADEVQQAQIAAPSIPPNLYNADMPVPTKGPPSWFDSIHVSMAGSFIAMEGAFRQRNENASGASDPPFSTIPLMNSPLYGQNETRFSAQQSRIALKASGDISPTQHVKGYYEMDFLGAAPTANSRESNSYTPRIRQAYFAYDNDVFGGHFSAGQMWSLATQNRVGILNSTENVPLTIDAQYVAGFNWARQPAIRFVEDWGKIAWFAVSVESSQTAFASNGNGVAGAVAVSSANSGTVVPPTAITNVTNNCNASGLLDSVTQCSVNPAPDIIEKFALDVVEAAENLRRGIEKLPPASDDEPPSISGLRTGLIETERSFVTLLERHGIKRVDPNGKAFDPNFHQAMAEQPGRGQKPGTVLDGTAVGVGAVVAVVLQELVE